MDREEKKGKLKKAFADPGYQKQLKTWEKELESRLGQFISWLKTQLSEDQKILENMETRIKSVHSFNEKLERKDLVGRWPEGSTEEEWQHIISTKLNDVIGFRINCYFYKDEKFIYDKLKEYYALYSSRGGMELVFDFTTNIRQTNGHTIYKVDGIYRKKAGDQWKDTVCFEFQIKSLIHNIWGEVDHRTVYKQRDYEINPKNREEITEQVFHVLEASDQQLSVLYSQEYTQQRIIEALFYKLTAEAVSKSLGTKVLAKHYEHFFSIFFNADREGLGDRIRRLCADRLLGKRHKNKQYRRNKYKQEEQIKVVMDLLKSRYIDYDITALKRISSQVIYFRKNDDFFYFLAGELVELYLPEQESDYEKDAFGTEEDETGTVWEDFIRKLDTIFTLRR